MRIWSGGRENTSKTITILLLAVVLATVLYWLQAMKDTAIRTTTDSTLRTKKASLPNAATSLERQQETSSSTWETYDNHEFRFSINYPCDAKCKRAGPRSLQDTGYYNSRVVEFPTASAASIEIKVFNEKSVNEWNSQIVKDKTSDFGSGTFGAFEYTIKSLHNALATSSGVPCELEFYASDPVATSSCKIVRVGIEKAILVTGDPGADTTYFFYRGNGSWIEVTENYTDKNSQKQVEAVAMVIHTLILY